MKFNSLFSTGKDKVLFFRKKIKQFLKNKSIVPIVAEIYPSATCNQRCPNCQYKLVENKELEKPDGCFINLDFVDDILASGISGVVISGDCGEPLLHPDIESIFDKVLITKVPAILITNGESFYEKLIEIALRVFRWIRISLDAYEYKSYETSHGVGADKFDKVISNIKLIVECKKELKSKTDFGVGFLTNEDNIKNIEQAAIFAKSLGVDYIQFRPYHGHNMDIRNEVQKIKYLESKKFKILLSNQKYSIAGEKRNYKKCFGANFYTVISSSGKIFICCHHSGNTRAMIWDLKQDGDFRHFITSLRRSKFIESFDISKCIEFCRHDSINRLLNEIQRTKHVPFPGLITLFSKQIIKHRFFL